MLVRDIAIWAVGDTVGSLLSTVYFIQSPGALIVTDWKPVYFPPGGLNTGAARTGSGVMVYATEVGELATVPGPNVYALTVCVLPIVRVTSPPCTVWAVLEDVGSVLSVVYFMPGAAELIVTV
jgi:hypothetical protein